MAAIYRVAVEQWSVEDALREMRDGGFGFDAPWEDVKSWFESLDFAAIRRDAGIR